MLMKKSLNIKEPYHQSQHTNNYHPPTEKTPKTHIIKEFAKKWK